MNSALPKQQQHQEQQTRGRSITANTMSSVVGCPAPVNLSSAAEYSMGSPQARGRSFSNASTVVGSAGDGWSTGGSNATTAVGSDARNNTSLVVNAWSSASTGSAAFNPSEGRWLEGVRLRERSGSFAGRGSLPQDVFVRSSSNPDLYASDLIEVIDPAALLGIHPFLAVQEMATRQGQFDRLQAPKAEFPNPFGPRYDDVWEEFYAFGKTRLCTNSMRDIL